MRLATWLLLAARDGMPLENGRFAGGPTTVLSLGEDQVRSLREWPSDRPGRTLVLTEAQRDALRRSAGRAPATLLVYDTIAGENDCCCEASDIGLWFSADRLEVPHLYLGPEDGRGLLLVCAWVAVAAGIFIALEAAAQAAWAGEGS